MSLLDADLLLTWLRGFPFGNYAFSERLWSLRQSAVGVYERKTQSLADQSDLWIAARGAGRSMNTIAMARSRAWFEQPMRDTDCAATEVSLEQLLHCTADQVLCAAGDSYAVRETMLQLDSSRVSPNERGFSAANTLAFRWATLEFPTELLIAVLHARRFASADSLPSPDPSFSTGSLEKVLAMGAAETHMHVNNGVDGLWLWLRWLGGLGRFQLPPFRPMTDDPTKVPLGSVEAFVDTALCIAVARLPLFERLVNSLAVAQDQSLRDWLTAHRDRWLLQPEDVAVLHDAMLHLMDESHPRPQRMELRRTYRRMLSRSVRPNGRFGLLEDVLEPFGSLDKPGKSGREMALFIAGFRALQGRGESELHWEHRLFLQHVRFRTIVHRYLTQRPGTAGLDWFRFYDRRLKLFYLRDDMGRSVGNAFSLHRRGVALRAMEARVTLEESVSHARKLFIRTLDSALETMHQVTLTDAVRFLTHRKLERDRTHGGRRCEIGLVLHFQKESNQQLAIRTKSDERVADRDDPLAGQLYRWEAWLRESHKAASVQTEMLRRHPSLLLIVRGIDVAARELSMPLWPALGPMFMLRQASIDAVENARQSHERLKLRPLRNTFHVGEDYRRLSEGLRRIHELIEFGVIGDNDRLGHALALGDPPARLAQTQPVSFQPAEERLADLLWEYERYRRGDLQDLWGRTALITGELMDLLRTLYAGDDFTIDDALCARQALHSPRLFDAFRPRNFAGFDFQFATLPSSVGLKAKELLARHLQDRGVWQRGQVSQRIEMSQGEVSFLEATQRWLRELISQRQITVESNPSSNLLVGDFSEFTSLPTFNMHPVAAADNRLPRIQLSINTDDPLTFATDLGREYAYMLAAMTKAKVPMQDAIEWINRVRECGLRSRFTLAASASPEALIELRDDLQPYPRPNR